MADHCILLGSEAGEHVTDESYYFELRIGNEGCITKQMTVQEYEWLTDFLGRCNNNLTKHDIGAVQWQT